MTASSASSCTRARSSRSGAVEDEDGVVHEYDEELAGEAMEGGPLMLTWNAQSPSATTRPSSALTRSTTSSSTSSRMSSTCVMGWPMACRRLDASRARALDRPSSISEWEKFCQRIDAGEETLIDPYGGEAVEEFFAVAVEAFFVAPAAMRAEEPAMYELLAELLQAGPGGLNEKRDAEASLSTVQSLSLRPWLARPWACHPWSASR